MNWMGKRWNLAPIPIGIGIWALPILLVWVMGCNSENGSDCFQTAGDTVTYEIAVPGFDKITVFPNIKLNIQEGETIKVEVETGANLRNEITAQVEGNRLILRNTNDCNFVRAYRLTTITVTVPDLTEIRSGTGFPIKSNGLLSFAKLTLISESFNNPETDTTDGVFDLELNSQNVSVVANGIAYFKLLGTTENLTVVIAAGDSRVEAEGLMAQNVILNHRGTNDMLINPQESLKGTIRGTGDVIGFTRPPTVDVEVLFDGRLIFRD